MAWNSSQSAQFSRSFRHCWRETQIRSNLLSTRPTHTPPCVISYKARGNLGFHEARTKRRKASIRGVLGKEISEADSLIKHDNHRNSEGVRTVWNQEKFTTLLMAIFNNDVGTIAPMIA